MRFIRINDTTYDDERYESEGWTPTDLRDAPTIDLDSEVDKLIERVSVSAAEQRLAARRAVRRLCSDLERAERRKIR